MKKLALMTLANALHYKKHLTRSDALKRAWRMVRQGEFNSKTVGVSFGLRQKALARLKHYSLGLIRVTLKHEPDNKHDKNAVAIMVSVAGSREFKIGYLPAGSLWLRLVEKNLVGAAVSDIAGGTGRTLGFNFKFIVAG